MGGHIDGEDGNVLKSSRLHLLTDMTPTAGDKRRSATHDFPNAVSAVTRTCPRNALTQPLCMRCLLFLSLRLVRPTPRIFVYPHTSLLKLPQPREFSFQAFEYLEDAEMGKDKDKDKVSYQLKTPKGTKDCTAILNYR